MGAVLLGLLMVQAVAALICHNCEQAVYTQNYTEVRCTLQWKCPAEHPLERCRGLIRTEHGVCEKCHVTVEDNTPCEGHYEQHISSTCPKCSDN